MSTRPSITPSTRIPILPLILLSLLLPLLTACSVRSGEKQIFPICMSLDRLADGRLQLAVQVSSMAEDGGYAVFTAAGDSFAQALEILGASMPYPLHFGQLRLCLVGWSPATEDALRPLLEPVAGLHTISPEAAVFAVMGNAAEVMAAQKPDLGVRLSTYLDQLLARLRQERLTPEETLQDVLHMLDSGYGDPLLGLCALNGQMAGQRQEGSGSQTGPQPGGGQRGAEAEPAFSRTDGIAIGEPSPGDDLPPALSAGDLPRQGGNPVEYIGCAAVGDGRVTGMLTAEETRLLLTLRQQAKVAQVTTEGALITIPAELSAQTVSKLVTKLQNMHCDVLGVCAAEAKQHPTTLQRDAFGTAAAYPAMRLTIMQE